METSMKRHYKQWTASARDHGYDDEKRLQREFNDTSIKLRFHVKKRVCQVWYFSSQQCYLIYEIAPPYNISRAIKAMKDKQKSKAQLRDEYYAMEATYNNERDRKIREMAREVAKGYDNARKGRVTITV